MTNAYWSSDYWSEYWSDLYWPILAPTGAPCGWWPQYYWGTPAPYWSMGYWPTCGSGVTPPAGRRSKNDWYVLFRPHRSPVRIF